MSIWSVEQGAGYIGGYEIAGVGNAWISGAGERYYYEPPIYTNGNGSGIGRDYPDIPTPTNPSPTEPQPPTQPQPPQTPTQQQPQPTQQQQPQPILDMFSRLRSMFPTSYTPSSPVVLLQPPQPTPTSYNYTSVFVIAIIAGAIIALYYIYKK